MSAWKPDTTAVAAKVIDGEAIIMNLTNGAYYSMDGAGAAVWQGIERGVSLDALVSGIVDRFLVDPSRARPDVETLVAELLSEGLIKAVSPVAASEALPAPAERAEYKTPRLNKYTEMADLLALDPPMPALGEVPGETPRGG